MRSVKQPIRTLITRVGNETNLLPILYAVFLKEFGRYIDIFGGSGAVLLGWEPCRFEVYSDIKGELVNLFRCVRNHPAELLLELGLLPLNARTEFQRWLHFETGKNEVRKHLPTQLEILDRLIPKACAEEMKAALQKRTDYRKVRQAAAVVQIAFHNWICGHCYLRNGQDGGCRR